MLPGGAAHPIQYGAPTVGWYQSMAPSAFVKGNNYQDMARMKEVSSRNPFAKNSPFQRGLIFISGERQTLNGRAILLAFLWPWLLFCATFAVFGFWLRYAYPILVDALVVLLFLVGVAPAAYWSFRMVKGKMTDQQYVPTWWIFFFLTLLIAFVAGLVEAEATFINYMKPYYNLVNLEEYTDIDTNEYLGMQLQDAGSISFETGTILDLGHSMGFKSHDIYCVSPIRSPVTGGVPTSIDFWAVGKNCCSGTQADFHCTGFSDPNATGALRLMDDEDRPFYRLAVQQAEATYKMTASHPLFFRWVHNADEEMKSFKRNGYYNFVVWISVYFVFQGFLVACATIAFAKLIHA